MPTSSGELLRPIRAAPFTGRRPVGCGEGRATKGRQAIEWTRYLRQLLGIDGGDTEADDLDLLLAADAEGGELRAGVAVTEEGWAAVTRRALDLATTEAAEGTDGNTDPTAVGNRVREVLAHGAGKVHPNRQHNLGPRTHPQR